MFPNPTNKQHPLFDKGIPTVATYKDRKRLQVDQVFIKEILPNGKPWSIFYISRWSLSFLERLKCLFTGRLYVIIHYNPHLPDSAPVTPSVSFAEPQLHKAYPFEKIGDEHFKSVENTNSHSHGIYKKYSI